jgi:hypothetical protein
MWLKINSPEKIMSSVMKNLEWNTQGEFFSYWIQSRVSENIAMFLRFPWDIVEKFQKEVIDPKKYSLSYEDGSKWVEWNKDISQLHHHVEWPHSLILYYDHKPLANVSYSLIKDAILIHQMQWVRYDYRKKSKDGYQKKTDNFELNKFEWTKTLVTLIEKLAKIRKKKYVWV